MSNDIQLFDGETLYCLWQGQGKFVYETYALTSDRLVFKTHKDYAVIPYTSCKGFELTSVTKDRYSLRIFGLGNDWLYNLNLDDDGALKFNELLSKYICQSSRKYDRREKKYEKREKNLSSVAQDYDVGLFEKLRELRRSIAANERVPAYFVFSSATLQDLASIRPTNRQAMLRVSGVGQIKLERYGESFLEVIQEHIGDVPTKT